jgi:glycosyltransferase involved in cell wall biosynthesis
VPGPSAHGGTAEGARISARPRLALVAHGIHDDGGMERAFAELVRRIHHRYEIVIVASELGPDLRPLVDWRRTPVPRRPVALRFLVFYALGALQLRRVRADLVHVLGAIVPNRTDLATIQFCHAGLRDAVGGLVPPGTPFLRRLNTAVYRLLCIGAERWSYRRRTRILLPVSDGVAREVARHYPAVPVAVARNGVDRSRFRPDAGARDEVRTFAGASEEDLVALFVGGDWDRKGLGLAIEGLAEAHRLTDRSLRLWVVGDGQEQRFRELARAHGVEKHVRFFGHRRDTERFYRGADVFVLPTYYEAFPLVALEAAASGLPIVATPANGIDELLGQGEGGILVERTAQSIGGALARLAENPGFRERLASSSRVRSALFTWERSTADVAAAYTGLLEAPPNPSSTLAA